MEDVKGKAVIKVGVYYVNGSYRSIVQPLEPASYIGVDIEKGPGVDQLCDAYNLVQYLNCKSMWIEEEFCAFGVFFNWCMTNKVVT